MIARRVQVTGRVQGVFFRAWARDEARALGVHGWVRNCADGSVEAHLEGDEDGVDRLTAMMRDGPAHALVDDISVEDAAVEGHSTFEVRL